MKFLLMTGWNRRRDNLACCDQFMMNTNPHVKERHVSSRMPSKVVKIQSYGLVDKNEESDDNNNNDNNKNEKNQKETVCYDKERKSNDEKTKTEGSERGV